MRFDITNEPEFYDIFAKHSEDLCETFSLKPADAAIQTASDLVLEEIILEEERDMGFGQMAAAAQKMFTTEDKLRLRKRPSHLMVIADWLVFMGTVSVVAAPVIVAGAYVLTLAGIEPSIEASVKARSLVDYAAMAAFWASEYADHKSTINLFRRVDTLERNPLFPRYGHEIISQVNGVLLVALVGIAAPAYVLFMGAVAKGLAALGNKKFMKNRLKKTTDELYELRNIYAARGGHE